MKNVNKRISSGIILHIHLWAYTCGELFVKPDFQIHY